MAADAPGELVAVHAAGQADVDERDVERTDAVALEQCERMLSVGGFADVVAVREQHGAIHLARIVVVVDEQHAARLERALAFAVGLVVAVAVDPRGRRHGRQPHGETRSR